MEDVATLAKLILFASIVNVWFFRVNRGTQWRGGEAANLREEFEVYGLSKATMYMVGVLKVVSALALMASLWYPALAIPASAAMAFLMAGAVWMHLKVKDPPRKALPAFLFFLMSVFIWLQATGVI